MSNSESSSVFDIFISYRREDTRADAGRLYDRLSAHFGADHVFMDIDDIDAGQNFAKVLEETLASCSVVIALIGRDWLDIRDDQGRRRLDAPKDFVRLEIRHTLNRNITVIPVLVGGVAMPAANALPGDIQDLSLQQGFELTDKRFHVDVDSLIEVLESADDRLHRKIRVPKLAIVALSLIAIVTALFFLYWGVNSFQQERRVNEESQLHLGLADQFMAQENYEQAIIEYQKALASDTDNIDLTRALLAAKKQRLLVMAFGDAGTVLDIGVRRDYQRFAPVPSEEVDDALGVVYRLHALEPGLKNDAGLLLDEALVLKTDGRRAANAVPLLLKAAELEPENARVFAELGLLSVVILGKSEDVKFVRRAIDIKPDAARYHFYLARALATSYMCPDAGPDELPAGDAAGCAAAIREYRLAADLAIGEDRWSRQIRTRSPQHALDIFHRYARKEKDILTSRLDMSVDERIETLEVLIPQESRLSRSGSYDYPLFWLALLYETKGDLEKAARSARELVESKARPAVGWLTLYARILEKSGSDAETLAMIKMRLRERQ